ncbi:hypothetical protein [Dactylosporangium sp. CS-033363]|uniref:hypothetical protein n=1 Tax=Dactylosporangium sp. CS-033363 TaxID=3239935 RepID=UPI003D89BDF4
MQSRKAFFSFTEVPDPAQHRAYNAWHQLDHRPENLALPGVLHGERWVRPPDCAGPPAGSPLDALQYLNMYWFRDPAEESFRAWQELAERSYQWGRRPDTVLARRLMMGSFTPVKGYAGPRVLVSPAALPFRPNRGVYVRVTRLADPHGAAAHERFAWLDREGVPRLLEAPGVAGVWTFASQSTTLDAGWGAAAGSTTFDQRPGLEPGRFRILLAYLDADPLEFRSELPAGPHPEAEEPLLDGVLRAIAPWDWDWFDPVRQEGSR